MVLEFYVDFSVEKPMTSYSFDWKLKFMKLSENAKAPIWATKRSIDSDIYSAVYRSISPSEYELVATDIALIPPLGVYSRVDPRSSLALKSTNVGAGVTDIDYRGNLQVLIINHSTKEHLHIEPGDKIGQFILTKFDAPENVEVFSFDATERGDKGFGSSGKWFSMYIFLVFNSKKMIPVRVSDQLLVSDFMTRRKHNNCFSLPAIYPEFVLKNIDEEVVNSVIKSNNIDFPGAIVTIKHFIKVLYEIESCIQEELGTKC